MNFYKLFFIVIFICLMKPLLQGQGFEAKIVGGVNASQLQGDNLSGFDKVGLHTGIAIEYGLLKNAISVELLFNQKGSASKTDVNTPQRVSTTMNYLQVPAIYSINSWYEEKDNYYHIGIHGGLYYARLFGISSSDPGIRAFTDNFRKTDFGAVVGIQYRISKNISTTIRYDQSFIKAYNNPSSGITGIISYLATLRMEYYF